MPDPCQSKAPCQPSSPPTDVRHPIVGDRCHDTWALGEVRHWWCYGHGLYLAALGTHCEREPMVRRCAPSEVSDV